MEVSHGLDRRVAQGPEEADHRPLEDVRRLLVGPNDGEAAQHLTGQLG